MNTNDPSMLSVADSRPTTGMPRTAVLVLGMHRSGTSALTRMISLLGADLPSNLMAPKADNNETGFWESQDVYQLNDDILAAFGSRWDDWHELDSARMVGPGMQTFALRAEKILRSDFSSSSLFVLKDPRICRLLPFWRVAIAQFGATIKCILVLRNPLEVAASLNRRDRLAPAHSYLAWLRHILDAEAQSRGLPRIVLRYEEFLARWRSVLPSLADGLGLALPRDPEIAAQEIDGFLARDRRHHAFDDASLEADPQISAWIKEALAAMRTLSDDPESRQAMAVLDALRAEVERADKAIGPILAERTKALAQLSGEQADFARQLDQERQTVAAQKQAIGALEGHSQLAQRTIAAQDAEIKGLKAQVTDLQRAGAAQASASAGHERVAKQERAKLAALADSRNALLHRLNEVQSPRYGVATDQSFAAMASQRWRRLLWSLFASLRRRYCGVTLSWREFVDLHRQVRLVLAHRAFDVRWYVERYPDVVLGGAHPFLHWMFAGWREGRQPGPGFDTAWYLAENPDVAQAGVNPLVHYLRYGRREGRNPLPPVPTTRGKGADARVAGSGPYRAVAAFVDPASAAAEALKLNDGHVAQAQATVAARPVGRFTVVMPTWNRRATVVRAIESVVCQSYADWELVVCDDGSDDGTEALVRERFAPLLQAGRIRYLVLEHKGVSAARNAGLREAQGDWIAYLDSDNVWSPHYLLMTAAAFAANAHRRAAYAGLHVHDESQRREFIRCREFDWPQLLQRNFIDLNVFAHHRAVYGQLGGFDESLTRLVDWELILRYTRLYEPLLIPFVLADYFVAPVLKNITLTEPLDRNEAIVRRRYALFVAAAGPASLRLAYVLWDWPALSQTFVLDELRELRRRGIDVRVYYAAVPDHAAEQVPDVEAVRVGDADELAALLVRDERNWIHSHFAFPAATRLAWPAAEKAGIAFSFMPHAVDIFHHANRERNRLGEMAASSLCAKVIVHGDFHRRFVIERGVPPGKIIMTPQAVDTAPIRAGTISVRERAPGDVLRVATVGRFIEKKGVGNLIRAAARMERGSVCVRIYGYGPLEPVYRTLIAELGVSDRVTLCGTFEGADGLRTVLEWADVVCMPCVEAENGDMDGMPTVLFEAMAAGVPCIAGAVSAIPDFISDGVTGYLVAPGDVAALEVSLRHIASLSPAALAGIAQAARDWTDLNLGTTHTVDTLLDCCTHPPLDIFMVTYHRDGYGDWRATQRAISSVLERTTTPMVLTIVDNGSDRDFLERLYESVGSDARVRILPLGENRRCGPASNCALELARSEFVIYVCSNEGYVARTGWERACIRFMRLHPDVAMGGRLVASPAWHDGRGYPRQPWFADFRNPEFARDNPDREFFHVQGGLYVLRRSVYESEGGFSERRPQAQTDVEYSYYLESCGHRLGQIPGLHAVSNKTRPGLESFLDETVLAAHPVFDDTVELIDACAEGRGRRCNLCGWIDVTVDRSGALEFDCPECASSGRDRALYRWLAGSNLHHRGLTLDQRSLGAALRDVLKSMFRLVDGPADVRIPESIPGGSSAMLGLSPHAAGGCNPESAQAGRRTHGVAPFDLVQVGMAESPACNICGNAAFGAGPGGRLSVTGKGLPRCTRCQSLERHRAFRAALDAMRGAFPPSLRVLQFSEDKAVDPAWFGSHEVSVWGGSNSLDLQAIDRADMSYDMVICNHVIEHVADDRAAMRELVRVLRPQGLVFLSFPDPLRRADTADWGAPDPQRHGHYRTYGRDVFGVLSETLPQATIMRSVATDPVTGATEMFFLISNEHEVVRKFAARLPGSEMVQRGAELIASDATPERL